MPSDATSSGGHDHDHDPERRSAFDAGDGFVRTCRSCGTTTHRHASLSRALEEARALGWRRVALDDSPGAVPWDLCATCAREAGFGAPRALGGWWS